MSYLPNNVFLSAYFYKKDSFFGLCKYNKFYLN
jgi:hypothetical protein